MKDFCKEALTFESVGEILWSDHSNETSFESRSRYELSAEPKAKADNTYRGLDYYGYRKNRI